MNRSNKSWFISLNIIPKKDGQQRICSTAPFYSSFDSFNHKSKPKSKSRPESMITNANRSKYTEPSFTMPSYTIIRKNQKILSKNFKSSGKTETVHTGAVGQEIDLDRKESKSYSLNKESQDTLSIPKVPLHCICTRAVVQENSLPIHKDSVTERIWALIPYQKLMMIYCHHSIRSLKRLSWPKWSQRSTIHNSNFPCINPQWLAQLTYLPLNLNNLPRPL